MNQERPEDVIEQMKGQRDMVSVFMRILVGSTHWE